MNKFAALGIQTSKIAEVDGELEEDSVTAHQKSIELGNTNTEQAKIRGMASVQLTISQQYQPYQEKKGQQPLMSAKLEGKDKTQERSDSYIELTAEQVSGYFSNKSQVLTSSNESPLDPISEVSDKISKLIEKGSLKVSKNQRQLQFNKFQKKIDEIKLKNDLQNKRYEIIEELKHIQEEEIKLRSNKRSLSLRHRPKYDLTEEDKKQLNFLLKVKRDFEQSLIKKNLQILESSKAAKIEEENKLKKQYEQTNKNKKEKLLKHHKEMNMKKIERQELLKQSIIRKGNAYMYKKKEKEWKRSQSLHELEFKKKIQQIKQRNALNLEQINQHEKKYSEQLENRILSQSKVQSSSPAPPKWKKTKFDRIINEQLFELKEKNKEKKLKVRQNNFREKIASFQQKVDHEHKPKVDPNKTIVKHIEKAYSSVSLTKEERVMKGLLYLEKAKQMKKNMANVPSVNPESTNSSKVSKVHSDESSAYKNYLKQKVPYNPLKKQLNEILSEKGDERNFESLLRAKFLSEGLQAKAKKEGDSSIYSSMKSKLKLLQIFY